jgi:hypothetical protein
MITFVTTSNDDDLLIHEVSDEALEAARPRHRSELHPRELYWPVRVPSLIGGQ